MNRFLGASGVVAMTFVSAIGCSAPPATSEVGQSEVGQVEEPLVATAPVDCAKAVLNLGAAAATARANYNSMTAACVNPGPACDAATTAFYVSLANLALQGLEAWSACSTKDDPKPVTKEDLDKALKDIFPAPAPAPVPVPPKGKGICDSSGAQAVEDCAFAD